MIQKGIRDAIIQELKSLPSRETVDAEPTPFDRQAVETEVREKLLYHLKGNSASDWLVRQMTELEGNQFVTIRGKKHPYSPHSIYLRMEEVALGQVQGKPFENPNSLLSRRNLLHVHHSQYFYIDYNFIQYFKWKYKSDEAVISRLKAIKESGVADDQRLMSYFMNQELMNSIDHNGRKTGEWIIYQQLEGRLNFICLYLHNKSDPNDVELYSKLKDFLH